MNVDEIRDKIEAAIPGSRVMVVPNESPSAQHSLLLDPEHAVEIARFLRDQPEFRLDFCSNVTGIDWPDAGGTERIKVSKLVDGVAQETEETRQTRIPGYLEVVYHLFSIEKKHGPVILRLRTADRAGQVRLPSLTPVWRSAEFQEREIFDLFGIVFDGHPDLRRILMWDDFADHPMRKDYVPPGDDQVEPMADSRT